MTTLFLYRGVPGTGKSTAAKKLAEECGAIHLEADMFFYRDGVYEFDATKLNRAHGWCFSKAQYHLMRGDDVVVSNTFTRYSEMVTYVRMAKALNVELKIVTLTKEYGSIHGVSDATMEKMRNRFASHKDILNKVEHEFH